MCRRDTVGMPIPPEVLFHRYFQELPPGLHGVYKGKSDLDRLGTPWLEQMLVGIQRGMTYALNHERPVPEHRDHPTFHVDYIDSARINA